jgi:O-antigen/teichoic acid export membrane protein
VRVAPAFFGAAQKDHAKLRRYVTVLTEAMSFFMFPVFTGLAITADDLVFAAFGPKWAEAIVPLQILSFYAFFRSIVALLPHILNVTGGTTFGMWNSLATLATLPPAFYVGSRWGVTGIAAVWLLVYPLFTLPLYYKTFHGISLSWREYLKTLTPGLTGSAIMVAAVLAVKNATASWGSVERLAIEVAAGVAVYAAVMWIGYRDRLVVYRDFYRRARGKAD